MRMLSIAALIIAACSSDGTAPETEPPEEQQPVGRITLTHLPVDPAQVVAFMGLGNLNVLPEDHGGFFTPREGWYGAPTIPVRAPADGSVTHIRRDWLPFFAPHGEDLALTIRVSTTMVVSFGHLSDFSPAIWAVAAAFQPGSAHDVDIPVRAGDIIGYIGTQGALDWYIGDSELNLTFVNPSRYPQPWLISGCYHDYYAEPQRGQLRALTIRTVEPVCGRIDYDVPGRIAGNWFLEGEVPPTAFEDYSTHLAIVYDEIFGDRMAISDGIAIRPGSPHAGDENYNAARVFWVQGNGPLPETVDVASGLVKYEILDRPPLPTTVGGVVGEPRFAGTFLVQLLDANRMRVERVMDRHPHEVAGFGPTARVYIR